MRIPVTVWNTPHASAFAEARLGAARDVDTFVWLYVGPGVGSAIVQDGALVTGTRGFAGEIGHCRVADDGPRCHCGAVRRQRWRTVARDRPRRACANQPDRLRP